MATHTERAESLAAELATLEARITSLREDATKRPFHGKKARCGRCGAARLPRMRLCSTCRTHVEAIKHEEVRIEKIASVLRAEHAIAVRDTDDLCGDARALYVTRPRGWRARERMLEVEINERCWDAIPSGLGYDSPAPVVVGARVPD